MNELPKSPPILFFCSLLEIDAELVGGEMLWLFWLGPFSLRASTYFPRASAITEVKAGGRNLERGTSRDGSATKESNSELHCYY